MRGRSLLDVCRDGQALSPEAARELEAALVDAPDDLHARVQLIGFYGGPFDAGEQSRRCAHIHWLISHHPDADLGPMSMIDEAFAPEAHQEASRRWLAVIAAHGCEPRHLRFALRFFHGTDPAVAEEIRLRGAALEPADPWWPESTAHARLRDAREARDARRAEDCTRLANDAIAWFQAALALAPVVNHDSILPWLAEAALCAGDHARASEVAERLLVLASTVTGWNRGNLIHVGNVVLGHVALARGDLAGARDRLVAAGATPGSPQLNSFGPDLELASALLAQGERDAVAVYLEACKAFWRLDRGRLSRWLDRIAAGETPVLDKFEDLTVGSPHE